MLSAAEIRRFLAAAIGMLARERNLAAFEIYCSSTEQIVARLNHTGEIPSRGVEEVKSLAADGFALRIVTRRDSHETGSAFVAGDLSMEGVRRALAQALGSVVIDPHFPGLPAGAQRGRYPKLLTPPSCCGRRIWRSPGPPGKRWAVRCMSSRAAPRVTCPIPA